MSSAPADTSQLNQAHTTFAATTPQKGFLALVEEYKAAHPGQTHIQALKQVIAQHPEAHQRYLAQINQGVKEDALSA